MTPPRASPAAGAGQADRLRSDQQEGYGMGRRFVTATEIDDLVVSGRTVLEIDARTVVTDHARERARDRGVQIVEATAPAARPNLFLGYPTGDDPLRLGRWSVQQAADWYAAHPWP